MSDPVIKLTASQNDLSAELPVLKGTEGPDVIDIRSLNKQTGMFTYDPGFVATASCRSGITYIVGDKGIVRYRGYPIEQLAAQCSFLEVSFLLLYGELPNKTELGIFRDCIKKHLMINESLTKFFQGFRYDSHPMAMLVGVMSSLSAFYHDALDINDPTNRQISAHRMIAKVATIAAAELPSDHSANNAAGDSGYGGTAPSGMAAWYRLVMDFGPAFPLRDLHLYVPVDRLDVHDFRVLITVVVGGGQRRQAGCRHGGGKHESFADHLSAPFLLPFETALPIS